VPIGWSLSRLVGNAYLGGAQAFSSSRCGRPPFMRAVRGNRPHTRAVAPHTHDERREIATIGDPADSPNVGLTSSARNAYRRDA